MTRFASVLSLSALLLSSPGPSASPVADERIAPSPPVARPTIGLPPLHQLCLLPDWEDRSAPSRFARGFEHIRLTSPEHERLEHEPPKSPGRPCATLS